MQPVLSRMIFHKTSRLRHITPSSHTLKWLWIINMKFGLHKLLSHTCAVLHRSLRLLSGDNPKQTNHATTMLYVKYTFVTCTFGFSSTFPELLWLRPVLKSKSLAIVVRVLSQTRHPSWRPTNTFVTEQITHYSLHQRFSTDFTQQQKLEKLDDIYLIFWTADINQQKLHANYTIQKQCCIFYKQQLLWTAQFYFITTNTDIVIMFIFVKIYSGSKVRYRSLCETAAAFSFLSASPVLQST